MFKLKHKGALRIKNILAAQEGMSLIEVLVALVIFSLVVVVFTAYFVNTFVLIHIAGRKSETLFLAQAVTEEEIDTVVGDEDELLINFPSREVSVKGSLIQVEEADYDGRIVRLDAFSPHVIQQEED